MIETVTALLLFLNGSMIEHVYKPDLSSCLKSKRIASRELNPERVVFSCKIITILIGVMLAVSGWVLTQTFSLSTNQAVQVDKVNKLERHVEKLQDRMELMMDKDEDIIEQHKKLFDMLEKEDTPTGYSYN